MILYIQFIQNVHRLLLLYFNHLFIIIFILLTKLIDSEIITLKKIINVYLICALKD